MKYLLMGIGLFILFGIVGHIELHDQQLMNQDTTQQFDPHQLSD